MLSHIRKAVAAVVGVVLAGVAAAMTDGISWAEWVQIGIAGFGAWQVAVSANLALGTIWHYTKGVTAGAIAGLSALSAFFVNGGEALTNQQWLLVAIAALTAAGVIVVPNDPSPTPPAA